MTHPFGQRSTYKPRTKSNAAKRVDYVFGSMKGTIIVLREATRGMGAVCILELRSTTRNPFQSPGDPRISSSAHAAVAAGNMCGALLRSSGVESWRSCNLQLSESYECFAIATPCTHSFYITNFPSSRVGKPTLGGLFLLSSSE